jgi:glycosyltransferase involved in cell wall biosynthesis
MDISVIVPTLNEEDYIEACLSSIYSQNTDFDFEVIVSDGGSEDRTREIAKEFTNKIVVLNERGTGLQRNEGAKKASAGHLLFLDADTVLMPDYLERAHTKFLETPDLFAFSSSFIFPHRTPKLIFSERVMNSYFSFRSRVGRTTLPGFNINIRRPIFEKIGGFRNVPLEDIELSIHLRELGLIKYFTDFYVITSSRRLHKMGLLGSIKYYIELDLTRKNPAFKQMLVYGDYFSCRIKNSDIQKTFEKVFEEVKSEVSMDFSLREYIRERIDPLAKIKDIPPKELLKDTLSTSISLADIGFREKIEKMDVDNAVGIVKKKIKNIKQKTHIKNR